MSWAGKRKVTDVKRGSDPHSSGGHLHHIMEEADFTPLFAGDYRAPDPPRPGSDAPPFIGRPYAAVPRFTNIYLDPQYADEGRGAIMDWHNNFGKVDFTSGVPAATPFGRLKAWRLETPVERPPAVGWGETMTSGITRPLNATDDPMPGTSWN